VIHVLAPVLTELAAVSPESALLDDREMAEVCGKLAALLDDEMAAGDLSCSLNRLFKSALGLRLITRWKRLCEVLTMR
jgi:hypothetical protein